MLDSAEAQRLFALAGLGIAHLPDLLVVSDFGSGRPVALPSPIVETIDLHALRFDRRLLPARARLFVAKIVEQLSKESTRPERRGRQRGRLPSEEPIAEIV